MPVFELDGVRPVIHPTAYVAPTAVVIGNVELGPHSSVWFGAVLRGDADRIVVAEGANIQDNAVVHCSRGKPTLIGRYATLGHGACIEGCVVGDEALVGTEAVMLQDSRLGAGALLAAGSVLKEGAAVPPRTLAAGVPARVRGAIEGSSERWVGTAARHYVANARRFAGGLREIRLQDAHQGAETAGRASIGRPETPEAAATGGE